MGIAAMGFAACDEFTMPNPPAQSNSPEVAFQTSDLVVDNAVSGTISLPALHENGSRLTAANVTVTNIPEGYSLKFTGELAGTEDFANAATVTTVYDAEAGTLTVSPIDLQTAFNAVISKDLVEKTVYMRYAAFLENGTAKVRVGGPDVYYCDGEYQMLPMPQETVIENAYYLAGSFTNWTMDGALEFNQAVAGNVYDNPVFSVKVDVTAEQAAQGGIQWKVVPLSGHTTNSWEGSFGAQPEKEGALNGSLIATTEAEELAGVIKEEGPYLITINMETRTYSYGPAFENLWAASAGTSLMTINKMIKLYSNDFVNYSATMRLKTSVYFLGQPSLVGVKFNMDKDCKYEVDENGVISGTMVKKDGDMNISIPNDGLYFVTANVVAMDWKITPIPSIQLIGAYNGWNTETALELTANKTFNVWTLSNVDMTEGEYKFCVAHDWAISYGGATDDIVQNGGNLNIDEAGTYDFVLHFDASPAYLEVIKK